ncbi:MULTISPECIES: histidinol dehydrogenase [unclassified Mesorhizobium]|uniref:histidinol dehydrogenase n=1 Tax=unclassified Mesorhizobium TaxID=325217 RepID=UPI000FD502CA|nr:MULTISPECIES: histidinol dehydrogenase [unclassified Mesorhizobium]RUV02304.1 histidinol dehydrogenase [Mesorhizobium sp. M6A.T.Cr.TU.017.01.1.1]RWN67452.1 MAG: histidinol dehydrogenase [Mesorhizobium sp.]RWO99601.1 MAG: histidinol dehydrogenase [Mesorhizobium sp.]RWP53412.1 MAG: histidinol dehydrogenase [Mesorhizobium sp.]RWP77390.1 MAG: histidinol dehydrogenase [Mesorhizobium sp.]
MPNVSFHDLSQLDAAGRAALMRRSETDLSSFMEKAAPIIEAVRTEGDAALVRFARDLDKADLDAARLKVSPAELDAAFGMVDEDVVAAIRFGIDNIRHFHEEQKPEAMWLKEMRPGAYAGDRFTPIRSVALYVPRGKGAFPSVTMMTAVPAVVAGVPELAIVTPPAPDGSVDAATLVAARLAGVETIYKCGGAQAVAAVAYGTETIRPALKIVGPGSPWVVAAKRLLAGVIDPGLPAGPSEAIILADDSVHGGLAALDLLIEAEHGPDSSAYLVTHSRRVAEEALAALPEHWARMTEQRVAFSTAVLTGACGGIVLTGSIEESYRFINDYAPEHLEILSTDPFAHLGHITEAAEILMGPHTPVSIGNFGLGPNAVLPTSRWARTCGPLSVTDFVKRSSIGYVTAAAYPEFARHARTLARYEGFSSHEHAVSDVRDRYLVR